MNILCIGDIVGKSGRRYIKDNLQRVVNIYNIDFVIANGENSAGGVGITKGVYEELLNYGIDVVTLGNHSWAKKEIFDFIDKAEMLVRPANYPDSTPGKGYVIAEKEDKKIAVINMCGRVYMECIECPFRTIDKIISELNEEVDIIILDFHAEATSEKIALGWYLDGRITAMFGTHTHVQTSDEIILPKGTGYITDVGMTGAYDSVLGVKKEIVIKKFLTGLPNKFEISEGEACFGAIVFSIDESNKTVSTIRIKDL